MPASVFENDALMGFTIFMPSQECRRVALPQIKKLLEASADPNGVDSLSSTPLAKVAHGSSQPHGSLQPLLEEPVLFS